MSSPATTRSSDDLALSRKRRTLGMVAVVLVLAAGTAVGLGVYFGTKSENGPSAFNGGIAIMPVNRITRPPTNAPDSPSPTISDSVTDAPVTAPVDADTPNNKNGNSATPAPVKATSTPEETSAPVPTAPPEPTNAPITLSPAASPLLQFISTVALQGGAEFQNSTSYQSQSLAWLENNINLATYSDAQKIQRYALGCIYFSTYEVLNLVRPVKAPTWTVTTGWMTDDAECTWWSISCDANGNVASIALNQNDLSGRFPEEVTLLASTLVELKLGNDFVNNIGDEMSFLGELTKLTKLDLQNAHFKYVGIPAFLGNLVDLEHLDLSIAEFQGPLELTAAAVWPKLTKLTYLDISDNSNMGVIPSEISAMPLLEKFYAANCGLEGDLSFATTMTNLFELWLDNNPLLGGTIPTELGNVPYLGSVSLSSCSFSGRLPSEFGYLNMQQLWVFNNTLTGTIPTEYATLLDLQIFQSEGNKLTGTMPPGLCAWDFVLSADCDASNEVKCNCCDCCTFPCPIAR